MMEIISFLFALSSFNDDAAAQAKPPLIQVRKIYVDRLTGGDTAAQMRDMLISSLQKGGPFTVTENADRADAILRGAAEDLVFTDKFSSQDNINAHTNIGSGADTSYSSGKISGRTGGKTAGVTIGESESSHIEERKHEAMAAVRLVDKNGDVIWSTTQESTGGKFRGASADVADRITRQLLVDFERARQSVGSGHQQAGPRPIS